MFKTGVGALLVLYNCGISLGKQSILKTLRLKEEGNSKYLIKGKNVLKPCTGTTFGYL